jgi:dTDP-4-dehydrorhamnose reductase
VRWLVTGSAGQLGHHLLAQLTAAQETVVAFTRAELDITDAGAVQAAVAAHTPDVVINAAAYTAVDNAETNEDAALSVNGTGPANLAAALAAQGGRLVHVSTDYVFAGDATAPYEPDDPVAPRTAYGRTKLAGEQAVRQTLPGGSWIVRTAWVHGGPGPNFVGTMARLESERPTLDVVADQIGSPTWVADLAAGLIEVGRSDVEPGVLHYVNAGQASWCDLAREVFATLGADPDRIHPVSTAAFPRPAPRPAWSVLSTREWAARGLTPPRPWQDAVRESLAQN